VKIAIIGPESTGKTVLSERLAGYFGAEWVPEYAREYVERLDRPYTFEDVCYIATHQIEEEQRYAANQLVIFDTDLIITKVWLEYCYQKVPSFVVERLGNRYIDAYLLCAPDLPWEPDTVREHGTDRNFFFDWYRREIEQTGSPYIIITGAGDTRFENAVEAVKKLIEQ